MANLIQRPNIQIEASLILTESELRALAAMTGYGIEAFLRIFYQQMGKSYLRPHEHGLRSLFKTIDASAGEILERADKAREAFELVPWKGE